MLPKSQPALSLNADVTWVPHLAEVVFPMPGGLGLLPLPSFVAAEVVL